MKISKWVTVCCIAFLMLPSAAAEDKLAKSKSAWLVSCDNSANPKQLSCQMTQTVTDQRTRLRIVSATVAFTEQNDQLTVSLPHGIVIQDGLRISFGKKQQVNVPIVRADQNGAYAVLSISEEQLKVLRREGVLKLSTTTPNGKELTVNLPLNGFSAGYDLLRKVL